jgi:hypothetical protein
MGKILKKDKPKLSLKEAMIEPFRYVWPIMLLLTCAIAGMIAFPKVDPNSPDMLYITVAFFGVAVEAQRVGVGMAKSKRAK